MRFAPIPAGQFEMGAPDNEREAMRNERFFFQPKAAGGRNWVNVWWETKNVGGTGAAGVYTLDPNKKLKEIDLAWEASAWPPYMPKGIDAAWENGPHEKNFGKTQPGVYAVDGDKLRMAWGEVGKDRPTSLTTKRGDKWTIHLYERQKE